MIHSKNIWNLFSGKVSDMVFHFIARAQAHVYGLIRTNCSHLSEKPWVSVNMLIYTKLVIGCFSGLLWLKDLNFISKANPDEFQLEFFNDAKENKPIFKREHLIMMNFTIITGTSALAFTSNLRRWWGASDVCIGINGKKKMTFAAMDAPRPVHTAAMIDPKDASFRGVRYVKPIKPDPQFKLYPVSLLNRTFIG